MTTTVKYINISYVSSSAGLQLMSLFEYLESLSDKQASQQESQWSYWVFCDAALAIGA